MTKKGPLGKAEKYYVEGHYKSMEAKEIAKFKFPERLELLDQFPVSTFGKVSKKSLAELITQKIKDELEM